MNSLQSSSHLQQEHELHASGHRRNRRNAYNPANIMFFVPAQNSTTLQCCIKFRSSKDFLQNATQMQQKKLRFAFSHHEGHIFIVKPSLHIFFRKISHSFFSELRHWISCNTSLRNGRKNSKSHGSLQSIIFLYFLRRGARTF